MDQNTTTAAEREAAEDLMELGLVPVETVPGADVERVLALGVRAENKRG